MFIRRRGNGIPAHTGRGTRRSGPAGPGGSARDAARESADRAGAGGAAPPRHPSLRPITGLDDRAVHEVKDAGVPAQAGLLEGKGARPCESPPRGAFDNGGTLSPTAIYRYNPASPPLEGRHRPRRGAHRDAQPPATVPFRSSSPPRNRGRRAFPSRLRGLKCPPKNRFRGLKTRVERRYSTPMLEDIAARPQITDAWRRAG